MKTITKMAAQGDVLFRRVDEIPANAKEEPRAAQVIVAHSETGHHHAIDNDANNIWLYSTPDPLVSYLRVKSHADVVHHRSFDTHEPIRLPEGIWEIRRQREWTPEGYRRVED